MITEAEYVAEQQRLGHRLHQHDGIWWEQTRPFYCRPVVEFRPFTRGSARPARAMSLLGYSHQVPSPEGANRSVTHMVLEGDDLRLFGLERIKDAKRRRIKKGLSACDVRLILDLEPCLERMRAINVAQAGRFEDLGEHGSFLPSKYYELHADRWRAETRRRFAHRGWRWWGAYREDLLVAYLVSVEVGQVMMINAVKSDPACFQFCPVDALHFRVLEAAGRDEGCLQVVHGGPATERPGLTHFKEQFLFRQKDVPYFTSNASAHRFGKNAAAYMSGLLSQVRSLFVVRREGA